MKEGWEYKKLWEIGRTQTGTTPSKSVKSFYGGEIPFIRPAELDIDGNGSIEYNSELKLTSEGALKSRTVKANSILMCCIGSVGKTGYAIRDVTCNQQINTITPYDGYNVKFVYYALLAPSFQKEVKKIANSAKATLAIISKGKWEEMYILVPPLSEQQRIVDYLDATFAKIDAMKANAGKALNEAKALFQASLKEMLEPKEGWEEKRLKELCSIKSKLVDPTIDENRKLKHVGGANITSFTGELIDLKTASEENLTSGKFKFDDTVVLYNKIRPYLVKVAKPGFSGLCSADMYPLTPNNDVCRGFLYYILISKDFTDYAVKRSARAGMPKVNRECLFAYKCFVPRYEEQTSIVATLDSLKSKVDRLQVNFDKVMQECDALKQAILRQVFE